MKLFPAEERRRLRVAEAALREIDRRLAANGRENDADSRTLDHVYVAIGAWRRGIEVSDDVTVEPYFDI